MNVQEVLKSKMLDSNEAILKMPPSNIRVCIPAVASAPPGLLESMAQQYERFSNVTVVQGVGFVPFRYFMEEKMVGHFLKETSFCAAPDRKAQKENPQCITPSTIHLSEATLLQTVWNHPNVCPSVQHVP